MTRFFVTLAGVSLLLIGICWALIEFQFIHVLPSFFFQTLVLLLFGTCLLYVYLYRFNKPDFFVHIYLLTMIVKLIAYGAYNFVVITDDMNGAIPNVIWFMILYLVFTVLEIGFLYQKISK